MPVRILVDTTSFPILAPRDKELQYFFFETNKRKHTIKYETGFCLATNRICWVAGGFPGSRSDKTIIRDSGLLKQLKPNEMVIADPQYRGIEHCLTTIGGELTEAAKQWNTAIKTLRQSIERWHHRLKTFKVTKNEWRGTLQDHSIIVLTLSHIVNFDLMFRPLDANDEQ